MIKIMLAFRDCEQSRRIKQQKEAKIAPSILITYEEYMKDIPKIIHAFSSCANDHEENHLMKYSFMHSQKKPLLPISESSKESFKQDDRNVEMGLNNQQSKTFYDENTFITYRTESSGFRKGKRSISTIPNDDVRTPPPPPDVHNGHSIKMKRRKQLSQKEQEDIKLLLSLSDRM
jgi:hypothetical protein